MKAGLLSAVSESREIYERGMDFEVGTNKPSVPAADLVFLHKKYVAAARDAFNKKKKMGSAREAAEYLDTLSEVLFVLLYLYLSSAPIFKVLKLLAIIIGFSKYCLLTSQRF